MKRSALLLSGLLAVLAFQAILNCSQPLESSDLSGGLNPAPGSPGDTLFVVDTIFITHGGKVDTVIVVDTVIQVDTVTVMDSTVVDTVIIVEPDPGDSDILCARLSQARQEVVWLFRNTEGLYHLEFVALPEREHPTQILEVTIDETTYTWNMAQGLKMIFDQSLTSNATIRIATKKPPAFGHAVDICLTMTRQ